MIAASTGLSPGDFILGSVAVLGVLTAMVWGAARLRARLLPEFAGAPSRLVEALLVVLGLSASGEVLGAVDALRPTPLAGTCGLVALGMGLLGRPARGSRGVAHAPGTPGWEILASTVASSLVAAQWVSHAASALQHGMTHPDTLAYHSPFAARFLQAGTFGSLVGIGSQARRVYPQGSELLHAVAAVPFHRDLLSPILNLGWVALVMLAAWCVGRRRGAGALCVLAAAVVLGLPSLAGTQPGQASNDVVCAALLLMAVALLLEGGLTPVVITLAGAAAGLGLATKLVLLAPVVVLTFGVVALSVRRRRSLASAAGWLIGLTAAASYWFIRDWIVAGSPAPFLNVTLGPISLRGASPEVGAAAVHYITNGTVWRRYYLPGLAHAFGPAWPLLLFLALGSAFLTVARRRAPIERLLALVVIVGAAAYPFLPLTGDGGGRSFQFNLRYFTPVLLLAFALLPLAVVRARAAKRRLICVAMVGLVALNASLPEISIDRMPAWPSDGILAGALAGLAVLAVVAFRTRLAALLRASRPSRVVLVAGALVAAVLVGGWFVQGQYFRGRYVDAGLTQAAIQTPFHAIRNASVATFGDPEIYPMFGPDLSNRVTTPMGPTRGSDHELCQRWKRLLSGRYRYVVLGHVFIFVFTPAQAWLLTDPGAVTIVRGTDYGVFRLDGVLTPGRCPS